MAAVDLSNGLRQSDVARHYGVSRTTVTRWRQAITQGRSLKARRKTGRPARIDRDLIREVWLSNPRCSGPQLAKLVENAFGIRYSTDHMFKLARRFRATQQAEVGR